MKPYASQESIAETLTAAERAAPFIDAPPDDEPLPRVTRECVLCDGETLTTVDPQTGDVMRVDVLQGAETA